MTSYNTSSSTPVYKAVETGDVTEFFSFPSLENTEQNNMKKKNTTKKMVLNESNIKEFLNMIAPREEVERQDAKLRAKLNAGKAARISAMGPAKVMYTHTHPRPVARTHPYAYTQSTCRQRPTQNYENTMPQPVHVPSQQCPSAIPYSNEWYGIQMQRSQEQTYYYPI